MSLGLGALALGVTVAAQAAAPAITSFSGNGVLVCRNLAPGSVAAVEWASSPTGPWTNNWAGLDAVTADANGKIQVSVPMFYRVRGITNSAPSGMALIPAGPFVMGDSLDGSLNALPPHTNQVSAFYMDKYEVTKALWDEVYQWATNHGYTFNEALGKAPNHPAYSMTWYDAVKWCNARSEQQGRIPAYYINAAQTLVYRTGQADVQTNWVKWSSGYRLPTEAEWEKAARGGASGHRFP
ncbi:MAG: SUMF1/EgtB/PvdO family nonheme iron enzyme, partial [bacterium]